MKKHRTLIIILLLLLIGAVVVYYILKNKAAGSSTTDGHQAGLQQAADCKAKGIVRTGNTQVVNGITIYEVADHEWTGSDTQTGSFGNNGAGASDFVTLWSGKGYQCTQTTLGVTNYTINVNCRKQGMCKSILAWVNDKNHYVDPATGAEVQAGGGKG